MPDEAVKKINISNMPEKDGIDKAGLKSQISNAYEKISSKLPGELILTVHFRESRKQGNKELVEVKTKAETAGIQLNASAQDWNAEKALKFALKALEKEMTKAIKKKNH